MTPTDLRALAERVETGGAKNTDIALALGRTHVDNSVHPKAPSYLTDLNLISEAWRPFQQRSWRLGCMKTDDGFDGRVWALGRGTISTKAHTLPRLWLGLLLRCMAAEMEDAQ